MSFSRPVSLAEVIPEPIIIIWAMDKDTKITLEAFQGSKIQET